MELIREDPPCKRTHKMCHINTHDNIEGLCFSAPCHTPMDQESQYYHCCPKKVCLYNCPTYYEPKVCYDPGPYKPDPWYRRHSVRHCYACAYHSGKIVPCQCSEDERHAMPPTPAPSWHRKRSLPFDQENYQLISKQPCHMTWVFTQISRAQVTMSQIQSSLKITVT